VWSELVVARGSKLSVLDDYGYLGSAFKGDPTPRISADLITSG